MKIKMYALYHILLSLLIFLVFHITGGVSAEFYNIYEVEIENNISKVKTIMRVYAPSEEEARANVSANGWTVISVKIVNPSISEAIPDIPWDTIDIPPKSNITIKSPLTSLSNIEGNGIDLNASTKARESSLVESILKEEDPYYGLSIDSSVSSNSSLSYSKESAEHNNNLPLKSNAIDVKAVEVSKLSMPDLPPSSNELIHISYFYSNFNNNTFNLTSGAESAIMRLPLTNKYYFFISSLKDSQGKPKLNLTELNSSAGHLENILLGDGFAIDRIKVSTNVSSLSIVNISNTTNTSTAISQIDNITNIEDIDNITGIISPSELQSLELDSNGAAQSSNMRVDIYEQR